MRPLVLTFAVMLALGAALAGCTKAPAGEDVTPASTTSDPPPSPARPTPGPSPTPAPTSPTPSPSPAPSSPTPSPSPAPSPPTPPASLPPDLAVNKSGWAAPNSQQDPSTTVRLLVPIQASVKNVTLRASDHLVTPGGNSRGAPFTLTLTDPRGRAVGPNASSPVDGAPRTPGVTLAAEPQWVVLELDATQWVPGEYTVTLRIDAGADGDRAMAGERYFVSAYVHYGT